MANVFDSIGNYLFVVHAFMLLLSISKTRLARQRSIKQQLYQHPVVEMMKAQVEEQQYIIMPDGVKSSFKLWWRSLCVTTVVNVRFPHTKHGNA